jgi:adenine-specific DNA-methyltransferase
LPEKERVVVCGTGIDTDARPVLRDLRPGSTLRKIPAALLDEYRTTRQLRFEVEGSEDPGSRSGEEVHSEVKV